jgi:hypothetical protein
MALTDVNFNEGEGRDFILEMARGNGGVITDVVVEPSGSQFPVEELTADVGGGGDIFIIND